MKSPSDPCKIDWITKEIEVDTSSAVETKIFHLHVNLHAISFFINMILSPHTTEYGNGTTTKRILTLWGTRIYIGFCSTLLKSCG